MSETVELFENYRTSWLNSIFLKLVLPAYIWNFIFFSQSSEQFLRLSGTKELL